MSINITQSTTQSNIFEINGSPANNLFNLGWIVKGNGDFDNDGFDDFVVFAPGANGTTGGLYIVYGSSNLATSTNNVVALNSSFSSEVSVALGDIDGDGKSDIIIGDSHATSNQGNAYVIFGASSGSIATDVTTLNGTNGFKIINSDNGSNLADLLGYSVSAGDIDGDGKDDVILGDYSSPNGTYDGQVSTVFGQPRANFSSGLFDISNPANAPNVKTFNFSGTSGSYTQLGWSVATGNINGTTGTPEDIIIGAPFSSGNGETYVVFGNNTRSNIATNTTLNGTNGFTFKSTTSGEFLGYKVGNVGDINNDGIQDLIVTAPFGSSTQRTYIVYGQSNFISTPIIDSSTINGTNGFYIDGLNSDDGDLESISAAGDINQDGIDDFLIAESLTDTNGLADSGQVTVIFGKPGASSTAPFGTSVNLANLGVNDGWKVNIDGIDISDNTGYSLSDAGDVNGDGYKDFLIGAPGTNGTDGTAYVVLGQPLDKPIPETTVDLYPSSRYYSGYYPLIGEKHTFIVNFDNTASSPGNVGYGPFIDLYLDTSGVDGQGTQVYDGLDLLGNGSNVGIRYITDSSIDEIVDANGNTITDPPHSIDLSIFGITPLTAPIYLATTGGNQGSLVVDHPYAGEIPAPSGYQEGDTLVVFDLPQGSFTPEQTIASFEVDVKIDEKADYNAPLKIGTSGGFRLGADTVLNPNPIDPILDTTLTNDNLTPLLYRIRKSGPYETVTGPNFEKTYNIRVDVAPGQTVDNLIIEDTLPDNVQYVSNTGGTNIGTATTSIPGGTVKVDFGTVVGTNSSTEAQLNIDFYVPLKDTSSVDVIDPNTGDRVNSTDIADITDPPTLNWDPVDTLDPLFVGTLVEPQASFTHADRSIAVQKSINSSNPAQDNKALGLSPGDIVEHTVSFQISDYFTFENLILNDSFSDGQIFVNTSGFEPTFTIYEHNLNASGTFDPSNVSHSNPVSGGNGTITLDISNQLLLSTGHHTTGLDTKDKLLGGYIDDNGGYLTTPTFGQTKGTIKFYTEIQEDFTTLNLSRDISVDNGDYFYNTATVTGEIVDIPTLTNTAATLDEGDNHSRGFYLPIGKYDDYDVSVYQIKDSSGNPKTGNTVVGDDEVTYRFQYTIPFPDIEKLNFTSELPAGAFDFSNFDLTAVHSGSPQLDKIVYGPNDTLKDFYLNLNSSISLFDPPGPTLSYNAQNDSFKVDYSTFDDPTTLGPLGSNGAVTVDLLYTLKVDPNYTDDGLPLTNLVHKRESNTNGRIRTYTKSAILELAKPNLNIQKGVVATTEDKAVFSKYFPVVGNPSNVKFNAPGNTGTRFTGTINSNLLNSPNFNATDNYKKYFDSDVTANLSSANQSNNNKEDRVTFAIILENTGSGDAFDVVIKDTLPSNLKIPTNNNGNGLNLTFTYGNGTIIPNTAIDFLGGGAAGTQDDIFNNGIRLKDSTSGAISTNNPTSGNNVVLITYDLEVKEQLPDQTGNDQVIPPDLSLTNTAILEEYSASEGGAKLLPGIDSLTDEAKVKTQPYLHVQFNGFQAALPPAPTTPPSPFGSTLLAGETFNPLNYLGGSDLTYTVAVKKNGTPLTNPSSIPFNTSGTNLNDLEFKFKGIQGNSASLASFKGTYIVDVNISDGDPNNNPIATPLYDVQDSFQFQINTTGTVVNNYIAGATVFFDVNKNGILDTGEIQTTTDEQGDFLWGDDLLVYDTNGNGILDPTEGQIVALGGINTATGLAQNTPLIANPDASAITPLTTIVAKLVDGGLTKTEANDLFTNSLSISNTIDINTFDPIKAINNKDVLAVPAYVAHTEIAVVTRLITNVASYFSTVPNSQIFDSVALEVANQINTGLPLDLTSESQLNTIINNAGIFSADNTSNVQGLAKILAEINTNIQNIATNSPIESLEDKFAQVEKFAFTEIEQDFRNIAEELTTIDPVVTDNTGPGLVDQIDNIDLDPVDSLDPVDPLAAFNTEIYRFQNTEVRGTYLFVGNEERDSILNNFPKFDLEGQAFKVAVEENDDLIRMNRFQNMAVPNTYLYAGEQESQSIRANFPNFVEEGIAFYVFDSGADQGVDFYRFQNSDRPGTYLFAAEEEKNSILANYPNFELEGVAFEVAI